MKAEERVIALLERDLAQAKADVNQYLGWLENGVKDARKEVEADRPQSSYCHVLRSSSTYDLGLAAERVNVLHQLLIQIRFELQAADQVLPEPRRVGRDYALRTHERGGRTQTASDIEDKAAESWPDAFDQQHFVLGYLEIVTGAVK